MLIVALCVCVPFPVERIDDKVAYLPCLSHYAARRGLTSALGRKRMFGQHGNPRRASATDGHGLAFAKILEDA